MTTPSFRRARRCAVICAPLILLAAVPVASAHVALTAGQSQAGAAAPALRIIAQADHASPDAAPDTFKAGTLTVSAPWVRATPGGAKVAGGYLRLTNGGTEPDRLVGGTAAVAGRVEVHEMSMTGGVMRMRPLASGLVIKAGETVELSPGGYHLMFLDLKQGVKEGDVMKATLRFEKAGLLDVTFRVGGIGAGAPEHKH